MTYTNTQAVNQNFQSIKSEGGRRTKKVADIFKSAFSDAMSVGKVCSTTVRPLVIDLSYHAVQVV